MDPSLVPRPPPSFSSLTVGTWESLGKRLMDPYLFQFSFFILLIHLLFQHVIVSSQAERVSISFTYY